jgi:hypothetical protein
MIMENNTEHQAKQQTIRMAYFGGHGHIHDIAESRFLQLAYP